MTLAAPVVTSRIDRYRPRRYAMTRPDHFAVEYAINPWMDTSVPVSAERAVAQWETLADLYRSLGHVVDEVPSVPGLPDMVFAANGATVVGGIAYAARFRYPQRAAEATAYTAFLEAAGLGPVRPASAVNEGEGDFLVCGERILAGTGFRTEIAAHAELAAITGRAVVTLELVNPAYYHLDTALAVLDDDLIAYYPAAFSADSQRLLAELYPDAIIATDADAEVLGLNAVSDGYHVVLSALATGFSAQLRERGFEPIGIDLSELFKGGGSVKCCTMEIRQAVAS